VRRDKVMFDTAASRVLNTEAQKRFAAARAAATAMNTIDFTVLSRHSAILRLRQLIRAPPANAAMRPLPVKRAQNSQTIGKIE